MAVNELDEDHHQLIRHASFKEKAEFACAITQLLKHKSNDLSFARRELRCILPKLFAFKRAAIPGSHDQRGIDSLQLSRECIGDKYLWMTRNVAIPAVL